MSLLPRATLHSDSEQYIYIGHAFRLIFTISPEKGHKGFFQRKKSEVSNLDMLLKDKLFVSKCFLLHPLRLGPPV